jgi:hypothetical protein
MPEEQSVSPEPIPEPTQPENVPESTSVAEVKATPAPAPEVSAPNPAPPPAPGPHFGRYSVSEAKALATDAKHSRVQKMLDRIMAAVGKRGSITNDETEQLLHVSNRTATNYLTRLFKSGLLTRIGSNRYIRYEKK